MASGIYGAFWTKLATGQIDLDTDTFKVMLTTSTYTEDFDAHDFRNDVTNEVTGTGYTAGGATITVTVNAYDTTNNRLDITLGSASWSSSTITARKAVVYKSRGGASTADELVACVDFGSDVISSAGTFTLNSSTIRIAN
jgi:hypothetical protein